MRSRRNLENARALGYCQVCGSRRRLEVHHIRTRGAGGGDEPENLILLCIYHHKLVQEHRLDLSRCSLLSVEVPGYEELLQRAVDCVENEQETRWTLGAVCTVLVNVLQERAGNLAAVLGCSSRYVHELMRVWQAFPAEEMRLPDLSWQHHRVAAQTDKPSEWLERAHAEGWSTREMSAAVKAEGCGQVPEDEAMMERARRAMNVVRSVLEAGGDPAAWVRREIARAVAAQ